MQPGRIKMSENPLRGLHQQGQSVWLDYLSRDLIQSGKLASLVADDGIRGITSNPTIFQSAIASSEVYDQEIRDFATKGFLPAQIFEELAVEDISSACDVLRGVYEESEKTDGFVSLEVSPHLAHDTDGTVEEARRLVTSVDRPNLMIKVPATDAGLPAIETLLIEGVNVNITLIFAQAVYRAVAETYLRALEVRFRKGETINDVASVASTFVSRIDTAVDSRLEALIENGSDHEGEIRSLVGKAAIANSKMVYRVFEDLFANSERFAVLAEAGASKQRPLWASTSTKNPDFPETLYVDELIGPATVNTMPENTMESFREHGEVQRTVSSDLDYWGAVLDRLTELGIDLDEVMHDLQVEGVQKFVDSYDQLLNDLRAKSETLVT